METFDWLVLAPILKEGSSRYITVGNGDVCALIFLKEVYKGLVLRGMQLM